MMARWLRSAALALVVAPLVVAVSVTTTGATSRSTVPHVSSACVAPEVSSAPLGAAVRELITVVAPSMSSTAATATLFVRRAGCWQRFAGPFPAELGEDGLSTHHVEGIPTTPVGTFSIGHEMYGTSPNPGVVYPYHQLVCGDWWDESPSSPQYNQFMHVACGTSPPFNNGEALWLSGPSYDAFAVIDYNLDPTVPGRGSGIFLHVDTGVPTAGCVSLPAADLITTLRYLRPADDPRIVIGAASTLADS
jgi:L,D-peptidoglycan transpeptidase YkuD (ErfK/YbiS/YcfS/YnhG family)